MRQRENNLFRTAAFLTAFVFLTTNLTWGQPFAPVTLEQQSVFVSILPNELKIPETLGSIQQVYEPSNEQRATNKKSNPSSLIAHDSSLPFVIVIQDAHSVFDAQNHIQELIQYLADKYGIRLIALEGGKGKLDPTIFRAFPDAFVKKKVMTDYLNRGELTGGEMSAILSGAPQSGNSQENQYYGIEDWNLYEENYLAYLKAMQGRDELLKELEDVKSKLDQQRKQIYSAKLNEFHEQLDTFQNQNTYLLEFLKYLGSVRGGKEKILNYPYLAKLYRSYEFEKDTEKDKGNIEASIRQMADAFKIKYLKKMDVKQEMDFHKNYQAFVTNQMDAAGFLKYLVQTGESFGLKAKLTPTMMKVLGHGQTLASIKGTKVFEELQGLIRELEEELAVKPEEKALIVKYERLRFLKDLTSLEITRDQLQEYQKAPEEYLLLVKDGKEKLRYPLEFYDRAVERDQAFRRNLKALVEKQKSKAVIVLAGGFHAQGFEKNLKEDGMPYVIITPKIESLAGQETYHDVMQGKLSYKPYLRTTFYDAFVRHSSLRLVSELNEPDFRKSLKVWRDEVIRRLSNEGRIAQASEYTRYIDLLLKVYYEKYAKVNKAPKSKEEILKIVEKELDGFRDSTVNRFWDRFKNQVKNLTQGLQSLAQRKQLNLENVSSLLDQVSRGGGTGTSLLGKQLLTLSPHSEQESALLLQANLNSRELLKASVAPIETPAPIGDTRVALYQAAGGINPNMELVANQRVRALAQSYGESGQQAASLKAQALQNREYQYQEPSFEKTSGAVLDDVGKLAEELGVTRQQAAAAVLMNTLGAEDAKPGIIAGRAEVRSTNGTEETQKKSEVPEDNIENRSAEPSNRGAEITVKSLWLANDGKRAEVVYVDQSGKEQKIELRLPKREGKSGAKILIGPEAKAAKPNQPNFALKWVENDPDQQAVVVLLISEGKAYETIAKVNNARGNPRIPIPQVIKLQNPYHGIYRLLTAGDAILGDFKQRNSDPLIPYDRFEHQMHLALGYVLTVAWLLALGFGETDLKFSNFLITRSGDAPFRLIDLIGYRIPSDQDIDYSPEELIAKWQDQVYSKTTLGAIETGAAEEFFRLHPEGHPGFSPPLSPGNFPSSADFYKMLKAGIDAIFKENRSVHDASLEFYGKLALFQLVRSMLVDLFGDKKSMSLPDENGKKNYTGEKIKNTFLEKFEDLKKNPANSSAAVEIAQAIKSIGKFNPEEPMDVFGQFARLMVQLEKLARLGEKDNDLQMSQKDRAHFTVFYQSIGFPERKPEQSDEERQAEMKAFLLKLQRGRRGIMTGTGGEKVNRTIPEEIKPGSERKIAAPSNLRSEVRMNKKVETTTTRAEVRSSNQRFQEAILEFGGALQNPEKISAMTPDEIAVGRYSFQLTRDKVTGEFIVRVADFGTSANAQKATNQFVEIGIIPVNDEAGFEFARALAQILQMGQEIVRGNPSLNLNKNPAVLARALHDVVALALREYSASGLSPPVESQSTKNAPARAPPNSQRLTVQEALTYHNRLNNINKSGLVAQRQLEKMTLRQKLELIVQTALDISREPTAEEMTAFEGSAIGVKKISEFAGVGDMLKKQNIPEHYAGYIEITSAARRYMYEKKIFQRSDSAGFMNDPGNFGPRSLEGGQTNYFREVGSYLYLAGNWEFALHESFHHRAGGKTDQPFVFRASIDDMNLLEEMAAYRGMNFRTDGTISRSYSSGQKSHVLGYADSPEKKREAQQAMAAVERLDSIFPALDVTHIISRARSLNEIIQLGEMDTQDLIDQFRPGFTEEELLNAKRAGYDSKQKAVIDLDQEARERGYVRHDLSDPTAEKIQDWANKWAIQSIEYLLQIGGRSELRLLQQWMNAPDPILKQAVENAVGILRTNSKTTPPQSQPLEGNPAVFQAGRAEVRTENPLNQSFFNDSFTVLRSNYERELLGNGTRNLVDKIHESGVRDIFVLPGSGYWAGQLFEKMWNARYPQEPVRIVNLENLDLKRSDNRKTLDPAVTDRLDKLNAASGKIVILDDTLVTMNAMRKARKIMQNEFKFSPDQILSAAILFAGPLRRIKTDPDDPMGQMFNKNSELSWMNQQFVAGEFPSEKMKIPVWHSIRGLGKGTAGTALLRNVLTDQQIDLLSNVASKEGVSGVDDYLKQYLPKDFDRLVQEYARAEVRTAKPSNTDVLNALNNLESIQRAKQKSNEAIQYLSRELPQLRHFVYAWRKSQIPEVAEPAQELIQRKEAYIQDIESGRPEALILLVHEVSELTYLSEVKKIPDNILFQGEKPLDEEAYMQNFVEAHAHAITAELAHINEILNIFPPAASIDNRYLLLFHPWYIASLFSDPEGLAFRDRLQRLFGQESLQPQMIQAALDYYQNTLGFQYQENGQPANDKQILQMLNEKLPSLRSEVRSTGGENDQNEAVDYGVAGPKTGDETQKNQGAPTVVSSNTTETIQSISQNFLNVLNAPDTRGTTQNGQSRPLVKNEWKAFPVNSIIANQNILDRLYELNRPEFESAGIKPADVAHLIRETGYDRVFLVAEEGVEDPLQDPDKILGVMLAKTEQTKEGELLGIRVGLIGLERSDPERAEKSMQIFFKGFRPFFQNIHHYDEQGKPKFPIGLLVEISGDPGAGVLEYLLDLKGEDKTPVINPNFIPKILGQPIDSAGDGMHYLRDTSGRLETKEAKLLIGVPLTGGIKRLGIDPGALHLQAKDLPPASDIERMIRGRWLILQGFKESFFTFDTAFRLIFNSAFTLGLGLLANMFLGSSIVGIFWLLAPVLLLFTLSPAVKMQRVLGVLAKLREKASVKLLSRALGLEEQIIRQRVEDVRNFLNPVSTTNQPVPEEKQIVNRMIKQIADQLGVPEDKIKIGYIGLSGSILERDEKKTKMPKDMDLIVVLDGDEHSRALFEIDLILEEGDAFKISRGEGNPDHEVKIVSLLVIGKGVLLGQRPTVDSVNSFFLSLLHFRQMAVGNVLTGMRVYGDEYPQVSNWHYYFVYSQKALTTAVQVFILFLIPFMAGLVLLLVNKLTGPELFSGGEDQPGNFTKIMLFTSLAVLGDVVMMSVKKTLKNSKASSFFMRMMIKMLKRGRSSLVYDKYFLTNLLYDTKQASNRLLDRIKRRSPDAPPLPLRRPSEEPASIREIGKQVASPQSTGKVAPQEESFVADDNLPGAVKRAEVRSEKSEIDSADIKKGILAGVNANKDFRNLRLIEIVGGNPDTWEQDLNREGLLARGIYSNFDEQLSQGFNPRRTRYGNDAATALREQETVNLSMSWNKHREKYPEAPVSLENNSEALSFGNVWKKTKNGTIGKPDKFGFAVIISDAIKNDREKYDDHFLKTTSEVRYNGQISPDFFTGFIVHETNLEELTTLLKQYPQHANKPIYVISTSPRSEARSMSSLVALLSDPKQIERLEGIRAKIKKNYVVGGKYRPEDKGEIAILGRGLAWDAFQIPESPDLVFKVSHMYPDRDYYEAEVKRMAEIAEAIGYAKVAIDGFELISIKGFAPFIYFDGMMIQQFAEPTKDPKELEAVEEILRANGIQWTDQKLENIGLVSNSVNGKTVKEPVLFDNEHASFARAEVRTVEQDRELIRTLLRFKEGRGLVPATSSIAFAGDYGRDQLHFVQQQLEKIILDKVERNQPKELTMDNLGLGRDVEALQEFAQKRGEVLWDGNHQKFSDQPQDLPFIAPGLDYALHQGEGIPAVGGRGFFYPKNPMASGLYRVEDPQAFPADPSAIQIYTSLTDAEVKRLLELAEETKNLSRDEIETKYQLVTENLKKQAQPQVETGINVNQLGEALRAALKPGLNQSEKIEQLRSLIRQAEAQLEQNPDDSLSEYLNTVINNNPVGQRLLARLSPQPVRDIEEALTAQVQPQQESPQQESVTPATVRDIQKALEATGGETTDTANAPPQAPAEQSSEQNRERSEVRKITDPVTLKQFFRGANAYFSIEQLAATGRVSAKLSTLEGNNLNSVRRGMDTAKQKILSLLGNQVKISVWIESPELFKKQLIRTYKGERLPVSSLDLEALTIRIQMQVLSPEGLAIGTAVNVQVTLDQKMIERWNAALMKILDSLKAQDRKVPIELVLPEGTTREDLEKIKKVLLDFAPFISDFSVMYNAEDSMRRQSDWLDFPLPVRHVPYKKEVATKTLNEDLRKLWNILGERPGVTILENTERMFKLDKTTPSVEYLVRSQFTKLPPELQEPVLFTVLLFALLLKQGLEDKITQLGFNNVFQKGNDGFSLLVDVLEKFAAELVVKTAA